MANELETLVFFAKPLIHSGQVTHICVGNLTIIVSDNGLLPGQRQAIIWTNAGILLIQENAFENVVWKMAAILFLSASMC